MKDLHGEWHEFESKARRREARRALEAQEGSAPHSAAYYKSVAQSFVDGSRPSRRAAAAAATHSNANDNSGTDRAAGARPTLEQTDAQMQMQAQAQTQPGGLSSEEMQLDTTDNSGEVIASSDLSSGSSAPLPNRTVAAVAAVEQTGQQHVGGAEGGNAGGDEGEEEPRSE